MEPEEVLAGRYRVTAIQRITGLSALYEVRDTHAQGADERRAVKEELLEAETPGEIAGLAHKFERKIAALKQLDHPAIPRIIDGFVIGSQTYLVMDLIEGDDLEDVMNDARMLLPVSKVYRWAVQLCDALSYLHTRKPHPIIFRDVKPANIMIDADDKVKLIDYGIAELYQEDADYEALGTDGYAAPEQYDGVVSEQVDVYGLGATLHHLLTRSDPRLQPPFSFAKRPIRGFNKDVPAEFAHIVMRAVADDQHDRYPSMAAMLDALRKIEGKLPA